ncbi:CDP-alcohol phosphatidyltransferase, partial [Popillia japonica]
DVSKLSEISCELQQITNGIDGKQARRTGTSGPLGELFDHGLDSLSSALIPILMFHIFGRSNQNLSSWRLYLVLWNVIVNFHLTHWEKYNTGVLFLPWSYDFSMWSVTIIFLIAGIYGHEVWDFTLPEAIRPLISITILFTLTTLWIIKAPDILERDPNAMFFLTGMIFSNICCRLIVAQMSQTRSELYNWLLFPTAITVFVSLLIQKTQVDMALLYALCIIATVGHIHYGTCVVRQMCDHFRIECFRIRQHKD